MIHDEEMRLRKIIRRLVLLACGAPAGAYAACTSNAPTAAPSADSGTVGALDAGAPAPDAGVDSTLSPADASLDAASGASPDSSGTHDAAFDCHASEPYFIDASYLMRGDANCFYFVDYPCGSSFPGLDPDADCFLAPKDCLSACTLDGASVFDCVYWPDAGCFRGAIVLQAGQPTKVACDICAGVGRRPAGLPRARGVRAAGVLGGYLAQAAYLEAASVHAFERLARELDAHGAPGVLVRAAQRCARDEVRHARAMSRLARRQGAEPARVRLPRHVNRSLGRVALENMIEGCVRETFGAVVATWQGMQARDPHLRRTMASIARDEIRHAALAWAVSRWAARRLDARARARVARAGMSAVERLRKEVCMPVDPVLVREAGLPDSSSARRLLEEAAVTCLGLQRVAETPSE